MGADSASVSSAHRYGDILHHWAKSAPSSETPYACLYHRACRVVYHQPTYFLARTRFEWFFHHSV